VGWDDVLIGPSHATIRLYYCCWSDVFFVCLFFPLLSLLSLSKKKRNFSFLVCVGIWKIRTPGASSEKIRDVHLSVYIDNQDPCDHIAKLYYRRCSDFYALLCVCHIEITVRDRRELHNK
jgi:hypothetical protein